MLGQIVDWFYGQIVGFLGNFFSEMGNMGAELFAMNWVQSVVLFFSYLGWALFAIGLVVACFECGVEYSGGRGNVKETALNAMKGFLAVSLFTQVPVRLYDLAVSLQADLTAGITGFGTTSIGDAAKAALEDFNAVESLTSSGQIILRGFGPVTSGLMVIFCLALMAYAVIKVFFANLKRGGILLIQIAVGSLYMFSVPRGYGDGFIQWCKQVVGLCLTAFLQATMSTALAQMNTFMDIALEQVICFDSNIDAEKFAKEKTAIFLVLPEEDRTKNFMAGLMIQNLSKELFELAEKGKGRLPNRVVFFCDEFGTMPAFDVEALFSAGRSRGITLVPIIQSLAQLEKNYGREGAEILTDNCQDTIFGGFAPNSQTAEQLSKSLGSRTVLSGSVSKGKNDPSQSLQMMERPLMTPDELKSIPKGSFVVMKTGTHPMQTKLRLFLDWGITFDATYATSEHAARPVAYASRQELFLSISKRYGKSSDQPAQAQQASTTQRRAPRSAMGLYSEDTRP